MQETKEKTEEKQEEQSEDSQRKQKNKRKRRCTKHDATPREYMCGCGRGYYSYPALYTHLKIKHDGKPPDGTKIPFHQHYGNRGRPKEKVSESIENAHEVGNPSQFQHRDSDLIVESSRSPQNAAKQ